MSSIFDFDLFRRPPQDLHERGTLGGLSVTLLSFVGLISVATWHVVLFLGAPTKTTEITVKQFRKDRAMVHMLLDVAMPCPLVDLEVHDAFGTHTLDAARNMRKQRIEANGVAVSETREILSYGSGGDPIRVALEHAHDAQRELGKRVHPTYFDSQGHEQLDLLGADAAAAVAIMVEAKEWCRFNGTVSVAKMPGRIFMRAHHQQLSKTSGAESAQLEWYNTSHAFRRLDFLDTADTSPDRLSALVSGSIADPSQLHLQFSLFSILQVFGFRATESPLSLTERTMSEPRTNWRYDLQVVGHTLANGDDIYDYTMGDYSYQLSPEHQAQEAAEPVSISYSFSPLTIVHKEQRQTFLEFIRSLLSTLGGCFAVLKIIENSVYVGSLVATKTRQGKYS